MGSNYGPTALVLDPLFGGTSYVVLVANTYYMMYGAIGGNTRCNMLCKEMVVLWTLRLGVEKGPNPWIWGLRPWIRGPNPPFSFLRARARGYRVLLRAETPNPGFRTPDRGIQDPGIQGIRGIRGSSSYLSS